MIFATVVERAEKELQQGQLVVELCVGSQVREDLFRTEYTMAESEVYFEPYFQVLKALKDMTEHEFPMRRYIVEAQRGGQPPAYLMADPPVQYTIEPGFIFPVLSLDLWPSAEELGLDDSQYQAFRFALTKEFVVIQGPPGTGKTYLGLKVAGTLLENLEVWRAQRHPILVVCYTNHALDQFLEGILQYTTRIIRVGGQSKCEKLNSYNLKEVRRNYKKEMYRNADNVDEEEIFTHMKNANNLGRDIHARMNHMMKGIKRIQIDLELLEKNDGIISLDALYSLRVVNSDYYNSFRGQDTEEVFVEWLLSQKEYNDPNFIIHVTHDYNMASDENNIVNEEVDVIEEVTGRATRDMHEGYDLDMKDVQGILTYADSLGMLMQKKRELEKERTALIEEGRNNYQVLHSNMWLCEGRLSDAVHKLERLKQRLKEKRTPNQTEIQKLLQQRDVWRLNFNDRWALYWHWIAQLRTQLLEKFQTQEERFRTEAKQYEEVRHMIDLEVMRDSYVVGMTTTGAARLRTLLQVLKPRIVIIEEAAEVLESHIIVSLTSHCQHLILIGDHQQLRPSTSVYRLAKEYNLDVSLFERMLNNEMHCEVLKVQHRMRPEIARLIVPAIYPELLNHRTVTVFEEIHGVSKSLFFIHHSFPDEQVADSFSHKNVHEADFILALCRHLILQGYEPDTITVLATYTGQMFYMKKASKKYELLRNVRITVVDNFQGEESDIILLSLVRSNENANIGFLKIENRVCVALSRARKGMYIMGNMENLVESSEIWPKIKEVLIAQDSIGQHLELRCKVHPEQRRIVSKAEDFEAVPEGGCGLLCDTPLNCGHNCQAVCHPKDREHKEYKCRAQPCDRELCVLGHKCKKLCFEECGPCMTPVLRCLPCGHEIELECHIDYEEYKCQVLVEKELPACKHKISLPCFKDPAESICKIQCSARLDDCGHTCRRKCHVEDDPDHLDYKCYQPCPRTNAGCSKNHACTKMCYEECGTCLMKVKKELSACGHKVEMPCSQDPITFLCGKKCERIMVCGHPCRRICSAICGGCAKLVTKKFPICQHEIKLKCCDTPTPDMCRHACERLLKCGHNCTSECGQTCTKQCMEMVKSSKKAACGHEVKVPCYKLTSGVPPTAEELLSYCSVPCGAELKCEHVCAGTCSKCLQGRIHVPCDKACGKTLICGHSCNTPCAVTCPPCNKKCMLRCYHNRCQKKCGQPCTPCQEKCFWRCKHYSCTNRCYQPCNRPPCYASCEKILKCGHPCIGFCGEWCPPLCRICDEEEVKTVVFGFEDEEDARFVFLEDCKHSIESRALEKWLKTDDGQIKMCVCPLCNTVIRRNIRYSNIIKPRYAAVCEVKEKAFGKLNFIEQSRNQLIEKLREVPGKVSGLETLAGIRTIHNRETFINILNESGHFKRLYDSILSALNFRTKKNRKNVLSSVDMETLGIQCEILCQLAAKAKKVELHLDSHVKVKVQKQINLILQVVESRGRYISSQEADDLNLEVQRFHRIADMCVLESLPTFQHWTEKNRGIYEKHISGPLMSIVKYSMTVDDDVKIMLEKFAKVLKVSGISLEERKEIVKAIGMKQGHWYKCPNGHIYVITECGGAMQIGKCNECGARIGGTSHSLLSDNSLAPEMDGAQFAAWSEAANMANYRLNAFD
ncbi:NFX1-type zinc finger-containing protein 1 isoform X3 [Cryptotermes secundus]|nr:NFX1-type zinc finger-containing protein 1 isoform X3 [Cryptotermes secundus]